MSSFFYPIQWTAKHYFKNYLAVSTRTNKSYAINT